MDSEIQLISDGDGLAVIGDATAIERFLASELRWRRKPSSCPDSELRSVPRLQPRRQVQRLPPVQVGG